MGRGTWSRWEALRWLEKEGGEEPREEAQRRPAASWATNDPVARSKAPGLFGLSVKKLCGWRGLRLLRARTRFLCKVPQCLCCKLSSQARGPASSLGPAFLLLAAGRHGKWPCVWRATYLRNDQVKLN